MDKRDQIYADVTLLFDTIPDTNAVIKERMTVVVSNALVDINRIADALEVIANCGYVQRNWGGDKSDGRS